MVMARHFRNGQLMIQFTHAFSWCIGTSMAIHVHYWSHGSHDTTLWIRQLEVRTGSTKRISNHLEEKIVRALIKQTTITFQPSHMIINDKRCLGITRQGFIASRKGCVCA